MFLFINMARRMSHGVWWMVPTRKGRLPGVQGRRAERLDQRRRHSMLRKVPVFEPLPRDKT